MCTEGVFLCIKAISEVWFREKCNRLSAIVNCLCFSKLSLRRIVPYVVLNEIQVSQRISVRN